MSKFTKPEFEMLMESARDKYPEWFDEIMHNYIEQKSSIEIRELKDGNYATVKVYEDDPDKMERILKHFIEISESMKVFQEKRKLAHEFVDVAMSKLADSESAEQEEGDKSPPHGFKHHYDLDGKVIM